MTEFVRLIDRECVICGGEIPSRHPRQLTCSAECRRIMRIAKRKEYRESLAPVVRPIAEADGRRRCSDCGSLLSAYNRGEVCHSCWSGYSIRQRERRGGDR